MDKIVFIKENSSEVRKKLKDAGFSICLCAEFTDSIWLDYYPDYKMPMDIHGVGYTDETVGLENLPPLDRINTWLNHDGYYSKEREFYDTVDQFLQVYQCPSKKEEEVEKTR